jgi:hypothetical protein
MSRATTKDVKSLRHAAMRDADHLRDQVRPGLPRLPQRSRQTRRATWYGDDSTLLAVVGAQEGNHTDRLLAHGLHLAEGRELALVLPAAFAYPTQFRRPWLTAEIDVWTHEKGKVARPTPLSKADTLESVKGPETARAYTLGPRASDWVRILVEWATQHRELVEAHTSSLRGWSYNGQRVLTIRGKRRVVIHAGINAKTEPATAYRVDSQLDPRQFKEIVQHVERGIRNAHAKAYGRFEEHHLQVALRRSPGTLLLEHPVLREVPAWRPRGRGFIDLVGMDGAGDVVLVETKLGSDEMLILQGLDYWIWASKDENRAWLRDRLYADASASTHLLYAVAGKQGSPPQLGEYEKSHLKHIDPAVPWRVALLSDWDRPDAANVKMLGPHQVPE